jgi:RecA-family ATPase
LRVINPCSWEGQPIPERQWLVPGLLPLRSVTMLSGDGGLGKSLLGLQLALCGATGVPFVGYHLDRFKSLVIACEDEESELHARSNEILAGLGCSYADVDGLELVERVGMENGLISFPRYGEAEETALHIQIMNRAIDTGARLVVLDSLHDLFSGNENDRVQVRRFVSGLRALAIEADAAVLLLAHPSNTGLAKGSGASGSTAWNNAVRSRLYLHRPDGAVGSDDGSRVLATKKSNYARFGDELELRLCEGLFVRDGEQDTGTLGRLRQDAAKDDFIKGMRACIAQGVYLSNSIHAGNSYAPKALRETNECRKYRHKELEDAMNALLHRERRIEIRSVKTAQRKVRDVLMEVETDG